MSGKQTLIHGTNCGAGEASTCSLHLQETGLKFVSGFTEKLLPLNATNFEAPAEIRDQRSEIRDRVG
jgi:hypothetical protein